MACSHQPPFVSLPSRFRCTTTAKSRCSGREAECRVVRRGGRPGPQGPWAAGRRRRTRWRCSRRQSPLASRIHAGREVGVPHTGGSRRGGRSTRAGWPRRPAGRPQTTGNPRPTGEGPSAERVCRRRGWRRGPGCCAGCRRSQRGPILGHLGPQRFHVGRRSVDRVLLHHIRQRAGRRQDAADKLLLARRDAKEFRTRNDSARLPDLPGDRHLAPCLNPTDNHARPP